MTKSRRLFVV